MDLVCRGGCSISIMNINTNILNMIHNCYDNVYCDFYDLMKNEKPGLEKIKKIDIYCGTRTFFIDKIFIKNIVLKQGAMTRDEITEQYDIDICLEKGNKRMVIILYDVHKKFLFYLFRLTRVNKQILSNMQYYDIIKNYVRENVLILFIYKKNKNKDIFLPYDIIKKLKNYF